MIDIFNSLASASTLKKLNIFGNELDDDCLDSFGRMVHHCHQITEIHIGKNNFTDKGIELLVDILSGNTSLRFLDLSLNPKITSKSLDALCKIAKETAIENIDVSYLVIPEEHVNKMLHLLSIPAKARMIPIQSNAKSAAKLQF